MLNNEDALESGRVVLFWNDLCCSWISPWQGRTAGSWPVWTCWWALHGSQRSTWSRGSATAFECAPSTSTVSVTPPSPVSPSLWENPKVRTCRRFASLPLAKVRLDFEAAALLLEWKRARRVWWLWRLCILHVCWLCLWVCLFVSVAAQKNKSHSDVKGIER